LRRLNDVLGDAVEQTEILRTARGQAVLRQWKTVLGGVMAEHAVPERFEGGVLYVACDGTAWAQEIRLRQDEILSRLNELSGERNLFQKIRVGTRKASRDLGAR
jgi:predicted nucleic acid-binding Zn ribbon protein